MTEDDRLIQAGQYLKAIITHAQGRFAQAIYTLRREYPAELTEEQVRQFQEEINQAAIDVATYRDLLRRCYEAIGVPNPAE